MTEYYQFRVNGVGQKIWWNKNQRKKCWNVSSIKALSARNQPRPDDGADNLFENACPKKGQKLILNFSHILCLQYQNYRL
jgi:hypothetical protein